MSFLSIFSGNNGHRTLVDKMEAINRTQAIIEFDLNGYVISANENFLNAMGYSSPEVVGRHHKMFVDEDYSNGDEYRNFWGRLNNGETMTAEFKRFGRGNKVVWIQASYMPMIGTDGKPYAVVKVATDITARKLQDQINEKNANYASALKTCQSNVMIVDNDLNIVYLNKAVEKMLKDNEIELKNVIYDFRADSLLGFNVQDFHGEIKQKREMFVSSSEPFTTTFKIGPLTFSVIASSWMDSQGNRLGSLLEWNDLTKQLQKSEEERVKNDENARVRQALDSVGANVMIADINHNIIYLNEAVTSMMSDAESDIRTELPNFSASNLLGKNIDVFHKNPAHQRQMLQGITSQFDGKAVVGGRTFTVVANPILVDGERLGTVVEWADRTAELKLEFEIDKMVESAAAGDFSNKIDLEGKAGFLGTLGKGLNSLTGTVEVALNDVNRMLGAMARGDLSERITRDYQGAFGRLKEDANATADKLTEIIGNIRTSSGSILSAANEISAGNADLSQRTEEQASALEETASSMEEMTSTVKQSAENAQMANELSSEASVKASEGGEVVLRAVNAMEAINDSSKKISDIISVIDEIAFQTNLLALNAAVEAARAGEQGRGFAVVAGEVRNLAQRSAGAAKEIKGLISDSTTKVQDGRELVNASGETLKDIVSSIEKVSDMMRDISGSAIEQTSGIEQVNTAISQMDEMTQQNAALVEQATAASAALADQANQMNSVVSFFSVSGMDFDHGGGVENNTTLSSNDRFKSQKKGNRSSFTSSDDEWEDF